MLVIRLKGGLGNQLFQYAIGYSIAKRLNQKLLLDPSSSSNMTKRKIGILDMKLEFFEVINTNELPKYIEVYKNKYINKLIRVLYKNEEYFIKKNYLLETKETYIEDLMFRVFEDIYLDGYFQTPLFFAENRKDLIRQLVPNYTPENQYLEEYNKIVNCNSVAIHIRRSDFVDSHNKFHYLLSASYYRKAIDYASRHLKNPVFYLFADDKEWVKKNIGDEFQLIHLKTEHADIDEMMLMKNCKNIITANSTFSWWAAWLNVNCNPLIIVPQKPYGNIYMIPESWIKIEV